MFRILLLICIIGVAKTAPTTPYFADTTASATAAPTVYQTSTTSPSYPYDRSSTYYPRPSTTGRYFTDTAPPSYPYDRSSTYYPRQSTTGRYFTDTAPPSYPYDRSSTYYPRQSTTGRYFTDTAPPSYPYDRSSTYYPRPSTTGRYFTDTTTPSYPYDRSSTYYPRPSTTGRYVTDTAPPSYPYDRSSTYYPRPSTTGRYFTDTTTPSYPYDRSSTYYPRQSTTGRYFTDTAPPSYPYDRSSTYYPRPSTTGRYVTDTAPPSHPYDRSSTYYPRQSTTGRYFTDTTSPYRTSDPYSTQTTSNPFLEPEVFGIAVESFTTVLIPAANQVQLRNNHSKHFVQFTCPKGFQPHVSTNIVKKVLMINSPIECNIEITADEFHMIRLGYVKRLIANNGLTGNSIMIATDGTTSIYLYKFVYQSVAFKFSNSSKGEVAVVGSTKTLNIVQEGLGTFYGGALSTENATVFANNLGLVQVKASNHIWVTVERVANIEWCAPHGDIKIQGQTYVAETTVYFRC